ncbi:MAG TPA: hypothetical protein VME92_15755 [Acetobacteraceae bacterium]|nr:hypothetical protein [Acetobacteraceae bacterium]
MKTILLAGAAALGLGMHVALAFSPAHSMYQPPIPADPAASQPLASTAPAERLALAGVNPAHAQYQPYVLTHPWVDEVPTAVAQRYQARTYALAGVNPAHGQYEPYVLTHPWVDEGTALAARPNQAPAVASEPGTLPPG